MTKRSYGRYCPVAEALDVVGERWTLLIVRELTGGPKRYTDLRSALPGAWPNLLVERLRDLEQAGLIAKVELPPPAARTVYELTEEGHGLEPVLEALTRWGMQRLAPPTPDQHPAPDVAAWSALVSYAEPRDARANPRTWVVVVDGMPFTLRRHDLQISFTQGQVGDPDLTVETSAATLLGIRLGSVSVAQAWKDQLLRATPDDPELTHEFTEVFALSRPVRAA